MLFTTIFFLTIFDHFESTYCTIWWWWYKKGRERAWIDFWARERKKSNCEFAKNFVHSIPSSFFTAFLIALATAFLLRFHFTFHRVFFVFSCEYFITFSFIFNYNFHRLKRQKNFAFAFLQRSCLFFVCVNNYNKKTSKTKT